MNAAAIWAGEEYAFQHYRGKGQFPMRATKGKCLRVERKQEWGKSRLTAYAILEVSLENGTTRIEEVRSRDVIDEWTSYEHERNGYLREREERARLAEERRQEMIREQEERRKEREAAAEVERRRAEEQRTRLVDALYSKTEMPKEIIISVTQGQVCLDRTMLEMWLSVP